MILDDQRALITWKPKGRTEARVALPNTDNVWMPGEVLEVVGIVIGKKSAQRDLRLP